MGIENSALKKKMSKERLEPTGQSILNICGGQNATVTKPKIGDFKASDTLSRVKDFLPKLQKANSELTDKDNLEDVSKDSKYVEMNIEKYATTTNPDWSADSDPDSTPSPPERDNAYTSDSDSSSSDSSPESSESNQDKNKFKLKLPSENKPKNKPNIEELN